MNQRPLVTVEWLESKLTEVSVVDGSWHLPTENRDGKAEYLEGHIPGAVFFDIDRISAPGDLPHMMPTASNFSTSAAALGLGRDKTVIVYDTKGLFSAARVWWMLRVSGFTDVRILDGGLPAWLKAGMSLEQGAVSVDHTDCVVELDAAASVDSAQVLAASNNDNAQILDARSQGRFDGVDPEPRAGLRGGHIPGSLCLPFTRLLEDGKLKPNDLLREAFAAHGVVENKPVITSCGSGVTAAILTLGLHCIGRDDTALYDGSWTEWGGRSDLPVVTESS